MNRNLDVLVINTGYWGIVVTKGQKYNFQFHLFTKELENAVVKAVLLDSENKSVLRISGGKSWFLESL